MNISADQNRFGIPFYLQSVLRGQATKGESRDLGELWQPEDENIVYYGKVSRLPASDYASLHQFELETPVDELLQDFIASDGIRYELVPDAPLERYETFDIHTDSVWTLWRIPFRPKGVETADGKVPGENKNDNA